MEHQEEQKDLAKRKITTISTDESSVAVYLDTAKFDQAWRAANLLSKTDLVPAQYKNKPENCFLAFTMATQVGANPFMFMQKTYVIQGKLGMEAQLVIALMNSRGPFTSPVQWEFAGEGKTRKCTAFATHKVTGQVCKATVDWNMVELEGWNKKPGSKWLTMPDQMFQYRSASFLCSLYCPEVKMGLPTVDELMDTFTPEELEQRKSCLNDFLSRKVEDDESDD